MGRFIESISSASKKLTLYLIVNMRYIILLLLIILIILIIKTCDHKEHFVEYESEKIKAIAMIDSYTDNFQLYFKVLDNDEVVEINKNTYIKIQNYLYNSGKKISNRQIGKTKLVICQETSGSYMKCYNQYKARQTTANNNQQKQSANNRSNNQQKQSANNRSNNQQKQRPGLLNKITNMKSMSQQKQQILSQIGGMDYIKKMILNNVSKKGHDVTIINIDIGDFE